MTEKKRILFICTGNACRSPLAEAILRHLSPEKYDVYSAGTHPSVVYPYVIDVLQEKHINAQGLRSKSINKFLDTPIDVAITLCDHAKKNCPTLSHAKTHLHWSYEDPARATGTDEQVRQVFAHCRDALIEKLKDAVDSKIV